MGCSSFASGGRRLGFGRAIFYKEDYRIPCTRKYRAEAERVVEFFTRLGDNLEPTPIYPDHEPISLFGRIHSDD